MEDPANIRIVPNESTVDSSGYITDESYVSLVQDSNLDILNANDEALLNDSLIPLQHFSKNDTSD